MQWFKNLHAMPKLLISFGILLALTGFIGVQAVVNMQESHERMNDLYQKHLIGYSQLTDIRKGKLSCGRYVRNAIIDAKDKSRVENNQRSFEASVDLINNRMSTVGQFMVTEQGKALVEVLHGSYPIWLERNRHAFAAVRQGNIQEAIDTLHENEEVSRKIDDAAQSIVDSKLKLSESTWQQNNVDFQAARRNMLLFMFIAVAIGLALAYWIARQFSAPLAETVKVLRKVADGDLTPSLEVETKDEVGQMAKALNEALDHLRQLLDEVTASSANVSSASQQLAATAENIAAGSQEQAASLEETSASLEEITAAVRQNADNAKEANTLAASSRDAAEQGGAVVSNAISAMSEINAASARISDIITTIDEIAFQTNLLAVNAAVEAARAGEQGRGFAVVASEVRNLAQRSAAAAKEIKLLIQDSLRKVDRGSELVNRSGETLQGIVSSVKHVTDIVGEIAAASAEQSAGIDQVNTAMTQMDRVTQSNASQTEELSSTAQALSEQSTRLLTLVQKFKITGESKLGDELRASFAGSTKRSHSRVAIAPAEPRVLRSSLKLGSKSTQGKDSLKPSSSSTAVLEASDDDFERF